MPGTLLLDCEGLSRLYRYDREISALIAGARHEGIRVGSTTMTRLEAEDSRLQRPRIAWSLSHLDLYPITRAVSDAAAELLRVHGLSGHKYAIDAALAAVARATAAPVTVATSDPEDLRLLCGPDIAIIEL